MRKLPIYVVTFWLVNNALAQSNTNSDETFLIIPRSSVSTGHKVDFKDLQKSHRELIKSRKGKEMLGRASEDTTSYANGVSYAAMVSNTANHSYVLECFRCGVGQTKYVNKEDCLKVHAIWASTNVNEVKQVCK